MENSVTLIKNAEEVLSLRSFHVNHWIISGYHDSQDINVLESDSKKILGLKWNPKDDYFSFKVKVNFSHKVKKIRTGPDLKRCDIDT